jgi:ferredoxin
VLHPHPGESVLETLERHGHHVEFQCRSGYCGACRTPLLAGKVHYAAVLLAFCLPGGVPPCCCQPVGAIKLDIRKG